MRFIPLFVLALLTALPTRAEPDSFGLGSGREGPLSVTTGGRRINAHAPLAVGAAAGSTVLRPGRSVTQTGGGLVLIHQSAGFPASTPSGGTGPVAPGTVGRWELARVASVGFEPPELRLTAPLMNDYTVPGAQVVVVPEYTSVTLTASGALEAPPWDGSSGGILAFLATGTVTNDGQVTANGTGFRGGAFVNHVGREDCTGLDLSPEQGGSYRGEGVVVDRFGTSSGRGNLVNAGGGGNCHNAGGGGGGHGGRGGKGGLSGGISRGRDEGGLGGAVMQYAPVEQALFGGGGGAGEGNNNEGSSGAAGGGIILVRAAALAGGGFYAANGRTPAPTPGDDAAGGGGAGGAVILRASGRVVCGGVKAQGGAGGNVTEPTFTLGPGGGGGGGHAFVQGMTPSCPSVVTGGLAGTNVADGGVHGPEYGASDGSPGVSQERVDPYRQPTVPAVTAPVDGAVGVPARPRFAGVTDPGVRVFVYVDGAEVIQLVAGADGRFSGPYPRLREPLTVGEHRVTMVAEALGTYSLRSAEVTFNVAATLEDGGVVVQPILVVPAGGDVVGPTPLFAGVAPNGVSVGVDVDDTGEVTVPVDAFGRFRYQVPADRPLAPGPHFVTVHAHTETGASGPLSQATFFESVDADAGTGVPDAGGEVPDAGSGTPDAGPREIPVLVVPAEGEVVDSTPLFAGVAAPGASVSLEVDGLELATVTADATGAFRHPVPSEAALTPGAHTVTAQALVSASGLAGLRSPVTGFEVRGPAALDVGCGCGASPAGALGLWALLAGVAAAARRRRR